MLCPRLQKALKISKIILKVSLMELKNMCCLQKNEPSLTIATDISESIEAKRQAENGEYEVIGDANDFDKYVKNVIDESSKG